MTLEIRAALVLLVAVPVAACSGDKVESKQPPRPVVPVSVATVERKTVPLQIQAIGTVEPFAVVSVKAQVGGELLRIHIQEGQEVRKGDLLFTIDPRTYEASVAQAEANLARDRVQVQQARAALDRDRARVSQARANLLRDQTQAKNAQVQERRYADLLNRGLIAQEQYDSLRTASESLAATLRADEADVLGAEQTVKADEAAIRSAEETVRADEAAVENAKVQLGYTVIRSPVDGRAGSLMLNQGNVVRAGGTSDSTLLVINQVQPIFVSFTVPQQQLPTVNRYMAHGKLAVEATPSGDPEAARGVVTFVDNAVDAATGTIRMKATFPNTDRRLWPGQFVNVAMTLATEADAIVVPSQAVQSGQQGAYTFVVKADSTVETRTVVVTRTQGAESIIGRGLEPGERVVTDGQPRLVNGAKVEVGRGSAGRPAGASARRAPDASGGTSDAAGRASGAPQRQSSAARGPSDAPRGAPDAPARQSDAPEHSSDQSARPSDAPRHP